MVRLTCGDYGFECDFVIEQDDVQAVLDKFAKHTFEEHGIEYSKEVLTQFIVRQKRYWNEPEVRP